MRRETQKKGDLAKAQAILTFTKMGYDVAVLLTESATYDLIIDANNILKRVQVKYCSNGFVDLRHIHSNSKGYVVTPMEKNEFDWLYAYSPDGKEYLIENIKGKTGVSLSKKFLI